MELYKQLDQLRQENFELKQKQRELIQAVNTLKTENEQLLEHTDEEIKRMSAFVDKFTAEFEDSKKQIEDDCEQRLRLERQKHDDLKAKMHLEQTLIDQKLDKLQREIEKLRQENLGLQSEKASMSENHRKTLDMLDKAQNDLRSA